MKLMKYVTLELPTHQGNAETTGSTGVILIGISLVLRTSVAQPRSS